MPLNSEKEALKALIEIPATISAARVHQFGGPESIAIENIPTPMPGVGQVLVRVGAAGVGPWDGWIRSGNSVLPQPLPLTLGSDLSGTVAAVGPDVSEFKQGDAVFGVTNKRFTGAYAEYAIAESTMIALKPTSLNDIEAASVPVIAVTAWQALFDKAQLKSGQTVLIHGAAGGVGAYAVQLAKHAGAVVITTALARDVAYLKGLGADQVIDYQTERFEDVAKNVDAVIDLVGGDTQARSFSVLKHNGVMVSAVSHPDPDAASRYGVSAMFFLVDVSTDTLIAIAGLIDAGALSTNVGLVLPLDEAVRAHETLEGRLPHRGGKIVISILPSAS
ncbi:zinc-binding dehydrogenase family protein [Pseudomonas fluorescens]|jgi:NADPH:quinone reductase-like Zn-dependent oxidoreductase|uniref:Zinc-binding dehydrogenase family protein n=1 Tax=Pseudomonas fluorescens TaxID=294 RepID=A0A0P8X3W6_PSEFL|nr:NADP-dependent oxidoreductase [Pseudomonas fluorescens]KPU60684.1 zinc-binding dehydrogenase family protein [Pseudomonas fluorescens]